LRTSADQESSRAQLFHHLDGEPGELVGRQTSASTKNIAADNPAIEEDADRLTIEACVNTPSWPTRAVVCPKDGSCIPLQLHRGETI